MINSTPTPLSTLIYEETIKITNSSDVPLNNIKLILDNLNINISQYKVVRERGSLTFTPPLKLIELGNLIPNETAEISFSVSSESLPPSLSTIPLENIKISYCTEEEECILSNLSHFLLLSSEQI